MNKKEIVVMLRCMKENIVYDTDLEHDAVNTFIRSLIQIIENDKITTIVNNFKRLNARTGKFNHILEELKK